MRTLPAAVAYPKVVQQLPYPRSHSRATETTQNRWQRNVRLDVELRDEMGILKKNADIAVANARTPSGGKPVEVVPTDRHFT